MSDKKHGMPVVPQGYSNQSPFSQSSFKQHNSSPMFDSNSEALHALEEQRMKTRKKKSVKILIILLIILLLAVAGAVMLFNKMTSNKVASQNKTAVVERGDFSKTITTNGNVQPIAYQSVSPISGGVVTSVAVELGSTVSEGDLLFVYKSEELEKAIKDAEHGVSEAENGVKQAKASVTQAINSYNRAVDVYNKSVQDAYNADTEAARQAAVAKANRVQAELAQKAAAEASARQAQTIETLLKQYQTVSNQKLMFDRLVRSNKAQAGMSFKEAYDIIKERKAAGMSVDWAEAQLKEAQKKPEGGLYDDNELISSLDRYWLNKTILKSQLLSMGVDPDNPGASSSAPESPAAPLPELPEAGKTGSAVSQIPEFDKVGNEAAIENARFSVKSAQLALESARDNLRLLKEKYNDGKVTATISGQVIALNIENGSKLENLTQTGKPAIQIADISKMKAQINVNEVDILKVAKDMTATMTFNAIPDYETEGKVETIASSPVNNSNGGIDEIPGIGGRRGGSSNLVSYAVGIVLDKPDPRIKVGMNSEVTLILEDIKDCFMIPLDAINSDGEKDYVNVVTVDGKGQFTSTKRVYVEVVSSNESVSAIKDTPELHEGDLIELFSSDQGGGSEHSY